MTIRLNYIILFFLLVCAALSTWLVIQTRLAMQSTATNSPANPDQFMNGAIFNRMDMTGKLQDQFTAVHLVHYIQNNATYFSKPNLLVFNNNQPPWHITADNGYAIHGDSVINIDQNVRIEQAANQSRAHTLIKTSKLTIYPDKKLATSDQFVTGIQPGATITAVGLRADMLHNTVNLLSQVHGYYAKLPQTKN